MKLKKIVLKGFKTYKELDFELSDINVLIGQNGAGKSNFLSLFRLIYEIIQNNLQTYILEAGGYDYFLYYGRKTTEELEFRLVFEDFFYKAILIPSQKNNLFFNYESIVPNGGDIEWGDPRANRAHEETGLHRGVSGSFGEIITQNIEYLKKCVLYHFHDTSDSSKMKKLSDINDNEILRTDGANIAAYLYYIRESHYQYYENILDIIKRVVPNFEDFNLRLSRYNNNRILLEWKEKGTDSYRDANYLSDGSLRFICLVTLLMQPELPPIIILDEPELGLHPSAINILAGLIKSASSKTQIICSTQSVTLVNKFEPHDIIVVDRKDKKSTLERLGEKQLQEWLEDYELGDLWEKNVIGGTP